jgi:hypothetical protein
MVLPGIVVAAILLAAIILHTGTVFSQLRTEPVFSLYPKATQNAVFFPHAIEGTSLIAERLTAYEGPFVEDGSNDAVVGLAALVLRNRGTQPLAHVKVELQQRTRCLTFEAQTILPGDTVLILESERQVYDKNPYISCTGYTDMDDSIRLDANAVHITVLQENAIVVCNQSDQILRDIRVEHKRWLEENKVYFGGITYVTYVGDLAPGQFKIVTIDNVSENTIRIVRITCK